jgi:O-antigen ligase
MRDWKLAAGLLGLLSLMVLVSLFEGLNLLVLFGGVLAAVSFLWLAFAYPEFFLVAALFIPQLKAYWPLAPIDKVADLTVAMLIGLFFGVVWRLMRYLAHLDKAPRPGFPAVPKWPLIGFGVFAAVVALSYSYSPAPSYGGSELLRFLGIGTLMLVAPFVLIRSERDLRRFVILFLGAGLILAGQMILHLDDRQTGAANDITRIGAGWLMGMLILLAIYYRPFRRSAYNTAQSWVLVPLFGFALIASAARGPITALVVVLFLNVLMSPKMLGKMALMLVLLGVSGFAAFAIFSHVDPGKYHAKLTEIEDLAQGKAASGSAVKRLTFYKQTLSAIPDHLILGGGIGSWNVFYYGTDQRGYPHNLFLLVAFEEGLVGIAALLFFLFAMGATCVRLLRKTGQQYAVFPSLVLFCLIVSMFSGDLDDNRILWYWTGVTLATCAIVKARYGVSLVQRFTFRPRLREATPMLSPAEMNDRYSSAS